MFVRKMSNLCFVALHANLIRNNTNKIAVERRLDTLLKRVGSQASWNCVTELLDSKEVVHRLTREQVDIFVNMLDKNQLKEKIKKKLQKKDRGLAAYGDEEDGDDLS